MRVRAKQNHPPNTGASDQSLRCDETYLVVGLDDEYFRVVNRNGEPCLYPKAWFEVVDSTIPSDWKRVEYADGEYYVDPPELGAPGFYEDLFDGKPEARQEFLKVLRRLKD